MSYSGKYTKEEGDSMTTLAAELGITAPRQESTMPRQEPTNSLGSQKSFQVPTPILQAKKEVVAFFGAGVECIGEIWYEGNVQIDGRLEGTVHTKGTLVIGDQAVVKAKIEAGAVICKGKIHGEVVAKESIKLVSPGLIDGTMSAPRLSVENGCVFNGRVSMGGS
jgi:cytoskeletal protein CcmA (bactofilin family)